MRKGTVVPIVSALVAAGLLACEANTPVDAVPGDVDGLTLMGGEGAVVVPNCLGKGAQITSFVPVSDSDWYRTRVEVRSSTCRTQPSGAHKENWTFRVLSDIPLPAKNVTVRFADEDGNAIRFNLFAEDGTFLGVFGFVCVFDADPFDRTQNATAKTTPSGLSSGRCTFDGA